MESKTNTRILRRMGFLADQEGLIRRYLREQGGWDSHLLRCRSFIMEKVKKYRGDQITILGSGWLLDVPLEELAETGKAICLVDINHPRQIRNKVKQYSNVELLAFDITGGLIHTVWKEVKRMPESTDVIPVPDPKLDFDPGLLISLNILTQTDTLLNDFLAKQTAFSDDEYRKFRARVQAAHLKMLQLYPHILISDYKEVITDIDSNQLIESNSLLFISDPPSVGDREEWEWIFDSSGEYYHRKRVVFKVLAIDNSE